MDHAPVAANECVPGGALSGWTGRWRMPVWGGGWNGRGTCVRGSVGEAEVGPGGVVREVGRITGVLSADPVAHPDPAGEAHLGGDRARRRQRVAARGAEVGPGAVDVALDAEVHTLAGLGWCHLGR